MELLILIVALVLMISFHHCQAFVPPSVISHYKHHRQVFNLFMSTIDAIETEVSSMRVKQIKDELESYGISTRTFLEKGELVEALVRARKAVVASSTSSSSSNDSTKKSKKKKRRSINDDNVEEEVKAKVEVITSDNVGPKTKKSRDSSQQGSSSNPFGGGGGGGSPFGGMGGMDIGDILKNMGGAGMGGAAGANPFGGMGGGDAMKGMLYVTLLYRFLLP